MRHICGDQAAENTARYASNYFPQFRIAGLHATTSAVDVVGRQASAPSLHRTAAGGPCNTEKLNLTDDLYSYILSHTPEPQVRWHVYAPMLTMRRSKDNHWAMRFC